MNKKLIFFLLFSASFLGCKKYDLSISQHSVDINYLASKALNTPDPRCKNPPEGEMLCVEWVIPRKLLFQNPQLILKVIYKNYEQETKIFDLRKRRDYFTLFLVEEEFEEKKGFLTYNAEIVTEDGTVYREWQHQLWVNLITLDDLLNQNTGEEVERNASTVESNPSVLDHPIQGSVTETP